jgi:hypothetical protein
MRDSSPFQTGIKAAKHDESIKDITIIGLLNDPATLFLI